MRHALLILALAALCYGAWAIAPKHAREQAIQRIRHHGVRLSALAAAALVLLAIAYHASSPRLL